jgi:hypothetical protein
MKLADIEVRDQYLLEASKACVDGRTQVWMDESAQPKQPETQKVNCKITNNNCDDLDETQVQLVSVLNICIILQFCLLN